MMTQLTHKLNTWLIAARMWFRLWWFFRWHTIDDFERRLRKVGVRPTVENGQRVYHLTGGEVVIVRDLTVEVRPETKAIQQ